ncbi:MAG: T9SS type A sorting domain-containing protein, partial [Fidelibacterota bacterium]
LTPGTGYHFRVVADNPSGRVEGADQTFTTLQGTPPTATTLPATAITTTEATLHGVVNPNDQSTDVWFDYGEDATYGQVLSSATIDGADDKLVSETVSGLTADKTYHYRIVAQSVAGIVYGEDRSFTTPADATTTIDVQTLVGDGEVSFPTTGITLGIAFTGGTGDYLFEVSQMETSPSGTIPDTVNLVMARYWEIEPTGTGDFQSIEITLYVDAGTFSTEEQTNPSSVKLLRRPDEAATEWVVIASATNVTDNSATFGISGFSQFTLGKAIIDTEPPVVEAPVLNVQTPVAINTPVTVTATVTDNIGLAEVTLYHSAGGGSGYTQVAMDQGSGANEYSKEITSVTVNGLVFFVAAKDAAGNGDSSEVQFMDVGFGAGALTSGIFPRDRWRLLSVPAVPNQSAVMTIVGDELGTQSDTSWRIFAYSGNASDPWDEATGYNLNRGEAYWLRQRISSSAEFDAGAGVNNELTSYTIDLAPGWNLIGNPYPFPVDFQLDQGEFYGPKTYGAFGAGGAEDWSGVLSELTPWSGYVVYNRSDTETRSITLSGEPPSAAAKQAKKMLAKAAENQPEGWLMDLHVAGRTYADMHNAIGRLAGASEELDHFDNPEIPYVDGFVSLAMERPDWGAKVKRFASDVRSYEETDGVWDLEIYVKGERGPIDLTYDLRGSLPPGNKVILLDVLTRELYDLVEGREAIVITQYREDFPYHLKIIAGTAGYVDFTTTDILASLPSDFALAPNYPNPFNPVTHLRYSLIRPAKVAIVVYNLLGQEVATLFNGWQDLGHYEVLWDGRDRFGSQVASGIYFAAFMAEGKIHTRKMVMMK